MNTAYRLEETKIAVSLLKAARLHLRDAGAKQAAAYVARALKSAEGAVRHAQRLHGEYERTPDYQKPLLERRA